MAMQQTLKEKQRQEREYLILKAAEEVLLERGYHDMSMGEVALRVGIAKGTLYQHFSSKESLTHAIFKQELQGLLVMIEQITSMPGDAQIKLRHILDRICEHIAIKRAYMLYNLQDSMTIRNEPPEELKELWRSVRQKIASILDEGKATDVFNASLPTEVMLEALFGLLSPRLLWQQRDTPIQPEEIMRCLRCIYFQGITAEPSRDTVTESPDTAGSSSR